MVLYLAQDLVWGTRIKSTGEAVGVACRPARTVAMLHARLADSPVRGIVLELPSPGVEGEGEGGGNQEVWAILDHLAALRAEQPERAIKVVVFGPHVDTEGLRRAKAAGGGGDTVMTRGAFHSRLPEILRSLESATG